MGNTFLIESSVLRGLVSTHDQSIGSYFDDPFETRNFASMTYKELRNADRDFLRTSL